MHSQFAIVMCILLMNGASSIGEDDLCASEQYVELSKLGIIQCNFSGNYYGAFWYHTTEQRTEFPFLYYKNSVKSGRGIESGEFDILPNGSLIINNVTLQHEHIFRVFMFLEEEPVPTVQYDVYVKVVVKPKQDYPIIDKCEQGRRTCFLRADRIDLSCYVRDSRPAVALSWWIRTSTMELNISESYSVLRGEEWESSYANITYQFENSLPLALVVCKAVQIPLLLPINESLVLLENSNYMIPSEGMYHSYVLHRGNISLSCGNLEPTYLLWKKKISSTHYKDLAYFIFGDTNPSRAFTDEFMVAPHGALVISDILVKHEGVHVCLYEKKMNIKTVAYNLTVYSLPVPPHLLVNGCTNNDQCTVNISSSGSLTCSIKKIRPYVTLQWRIVHEEDRGSITFSNQLIENRQVDEVYDVTLTSNFRVERTSRKNLALECITTGQHSNFLHYQRGLTLVLLDTYESYDTVTSSASDESVNLGRLNIVGIVVAAATVLVVLVVLGIIIWRVYRKKQSKTNAQPIAPSPEETPLTEIDSGEQARADDLVKTLRNYYEILYNDLRPVHIDQHKRFQVGKLFCDNIRQFMKTEKLTDNEIWEKIDSHHNVIASVKDPGTVVIIEGDVGYGKTMFSLKLIQEWCENDKKSSLKGVEVVIFLRVNELTKCSSLYGAIQSALLPKDSNISSTDIEKVLKKCQSVVIILDDYEKIHQKLVWLTDILRKKTLRHCKVVITTRSFEFVKSIVISSKRFRLTAFSEETRKEYIHNYVGKKDGKKFVEQVKTELLENVILNELCKIPLLLVAYIHLRCEPNYNNESKSSISIFCYLLKCVELHHQNKARHQADASISSETEALAKGKVIALSTDQEDMEKTELLNQICFLPSFASYFTDFLDTFINCYSDMEIPATWLKYELNRELSTIRDSLTKFCSEHVEITTCEYPLLQRSKIELLKLASNNEIPIEDVSFTNCVDVELSTKDMLVITSGMEIPVLETVKKITFDGKQTKIKNEEAELMLMYCNHCTHIETVQFRRLKMPRLLENCTKFLRKDITVRWNFSDEKEFVLQMQSGLWIDSQCKKTPRKRRLKSSDW